MTIKSSAPGMPTEYYFKQRIVSDHLIPVIVHVGEFSILTQPCREDCVRKRKRTSAANRPEHAAVPIHGRVAWDKEFPCQPGQEEPSPSASLEEVCQLVSEQSFHHSEHTIASGKPPKRQCLFTFPFTLIFLSSQCPRSLIKILLHYLHCTP